MATRGAERFYRIKGTRQKACYRRRKSHEQDTRERVELLSTTTATSPVHLPFRCRSFGRYAVVPLGLACKRYGMTA